MSEAAAGKRITAARAARRFPLVLEMMAGGEIHLTAVNMLAAHLTDENHGELLERARHRSKRELEKLVAEIAPRPDVPSRIVALPQSAAAATGVGLEVRAPERVARAVVAPLSPRRYEIRVTVDEATHERLVQLQDLLAHSVGRDPAVIIAQAIDSLHEKTLARKAAVTKRPRRGKPADKRSRHIPVAVRRSVWTRDGARCAFVDGKERRCSATSGLEFHHINNWARGAGHSIDEIELRCSAHNRYQALLDYGAELMARKRAGRSSAREPPARASPRGRAA
jgi:5-methylcytosine-specific restriction endonuclease McrA